MAKKNIVTIGFELASDVSHYASIDSKLSLLDWDIILIKPVIHDFIANRTYQGRPTYDEGTSFKLRECVAHWRREINEAVDSGKVVVVFLAPHEDIYIDSGRRTYSGTGKNQKTTIQVESFSNYEMLPAKLGPIATFGRSIKLTPKGSEHLSSYWADFEEFSKYSVVLGAKMLPATLMTRSGEKVVGCTFRSKTSSGALVLVPDIDFYDERFEDDNDDWSESGTQFASRMIASMVALEKSLRSQGERTAEPSWVTDRQYMMPTEPALLLELLELEQRIEETQRQKEETVATLQIIGGIRSLLFEKGKPLESAIIEALGILGFEAHPFQNAESEFDVVFQSDEGRLVGEAEGKDTKAVNIEKLRQLSMNIHEDLLRDEVSQPAKAVLFGNGYRLIPLSERQDPFTTKCTSAALSTGTALVFTPDLLPIIQYLTETGDMGYALACREAILAQSGRVTFPALPEASTNTPEEDMALA